MTKIGLSAPELSKKKRAFTKGMVRWLHDNKYQVGTNVQGVEQAEDIASKTALLSAKVDAVTGGLGSVIAVFVSGGASAEEVREAVEPFTPLSDIVGLRSSGDGLLAVIYADELPTETIGLRFEQLFELGVRIRKIANMRVFGLGSAFVFPLLVYFDGRQYYRNAPIMLESGYKRRMGSSFGGSVTLVAGFANVPERTVTWAKGGTLIEKEALRPTIRKSDAWLRKHNLP